MTESLHPRSPFASLKLVPQPDWSVERQRAFLHMLLRTGDVGVAAARVGADIAAVRALRRKLGLRSGFAKAWRWAVREAEDEALADRFLRRHGLDDAQMARVDVAVHGSAKVQLAIALYQRARGRPHG